MGKGQRENTVQPGLDRRQAPVNTNTDKITHRVQARSSAARPCRISTTALRSAQARISQNGTLSENNGSCLPLVALTCIRLLEATVLLGQLRQKEDVQQVQPIGSRPVKPSYTAARPAAHPAIFSLLLPSPFAGPVPRKRSQPATGAQSWNASQRIRPSENWRSALGAFARYKLAAVRCWPIQSAKRCTSAGSKKAIISS